MTKELQATAGPYVVEFVPDGARSLCATVNIITFAYRQLSLDRSRKA